MVQCQHKYLLLYIYSNTLSEKQNIARGISTEQLATLVIDEVTEGGLVRQISILSNGLPVVIECRRGYYVMS